MSVQMESELLYGSTKVKINAYKVNRIPNIKSNIRVTHWRPLTKKWENLRHSPALNKNQMWII